MSIQSVLINGGTTEDEINFNKLNPGTSGSEVPVSFHKDDILVGSPTPSIPQTVVTAYIDPDDLIDFINEEQFDVAQQLFHANLKGLDWADSNHRSNFLTPTVACFNSDGEPVARNIPDFTSDLSHSNLLNLKWATCGHVSDSVVPTVACFNSDGEAVVKDIPTLASNFSHTDLADLEWGGSGHYIEPGDFKFAAFESDGEAIAVLPRYAAIMIGPELHHYELDSLAWDVCGHTGTPGTIAAFDEVDGYALEITPQNIVDAAVIDHADLDNLAWETCGHTGPENTIAVFNAVGHADTVTLEELVDFTPIEASVTDLQEQIDELTTNVAAEFALLKQRVTPLLTVGGAKSAVEYMEATADNTASSAMSIARATMTFHIQEGAAKNYTEMSVTTSTANAGNTVALALYAVDPTTGLPTDLIWVGNGISTGTAGTKIWDLTNSAHGTWQSAAGAYKTSGNALRLLHGDAVGKAYITSNTSSGVASVRTVGNAKPILGRPQDASQKPWTGFRAVSATGTFPATFVYGTAAGEYELINSAIPVICLA